MRASRQRRRLRGGEHVGGPLPPIENLDPTVDPDPVPANRAARRRKGPKQVPAAARYRGSTGHPQPAPQGRRINPVRRTG